jgi:hypothetical protein
MTEAIFVEESESLDLELYADVRKREIPSEAGQNCVVFYCGKLPVSLLLEDNTYYSLNIYAHRDMKFRPAQGTKLTELDCDEEEQYWLNPVAFCLDTVDDWEIKFGEKTYQGTFRFFELTKKECRIAHIDNDPDESIGGYDFYFFDEKTAVDGFCLEERTAMSLLNIQDEPRAHHYLSQLIFARICLKMIGKENLVTLPPRTVECAFIGRVPFALMSDGEVIDHAFTNCYEKIIFHDKDKKMAATKLCIIEYDYSVEQKISEEDQSEKIYSIYDSNFLRFPVAFVEDTQVNLPNFTRKICRIGPFSGEYSDQQRTFKNIELSYFESGEEKTALFEHHYSVLIPDLKFIIEKCAKFSDEFPQSTCSRSSNNYPMVKSGSEVLIFSEEALLKDELGIFIESLPEYPGKDFLLRYEPYYLNDCQELIGINLGNEKIVDLQLTFCITAFDKLQELLGEFLCLDVISIIKEMLCDYLPGDPSAKREKLFKTVCKCLSRREYFSVSIEKMIEML